MGGRDVKEITRRILETLFKSSLAIHLNYEGRGEKWGVKQLKLIPVIIGIIMIFVIVKLHSISHHNYTFVVKPMNVNKHMGSKKDWAIWFTVRNQYLPILR